MKWGSLAMSIALVTVALLSRIDGFMEAACVFLAGMFFAWFADSIT